MDVFKIISDRKNLTATQAEEAMDLIMAGNVQSAIIESFLLGLRSKGETAEEILGFVRSIRKHARPIHIHRKDLMDTCGTGGDGAKTFNISTAVAFVVAAAGVGVAKHGNRSISSLSGSADVYESLGLTIHTDANKISESIEKFSLGFLYAPHFHPAMGVVAPIRKSLGLRTVFNILGPLVNPAKVRRQIIGVYHHSLLEKVGQVLVELDLEEALVVSGQDGLDEISLTAPTQALHMKSGLIRPLVIQPQEFKFSPCTMEELRGGQASENALIIEDLLEGKKGPCLDIVALNAGAALWIAGLVKDISTGIKESLNLIESKKAKDTLERLRQFV